MRVFKGIPIKKGILLVVVVCCCTSVGAQQEPVFTHYAFNPLMTNPAVAGSEELLTVNAVSRFRWVKFPGAPKTQNLTVHSILKTRSVGAGLSFVNDSKGPAQFTGVDLNVAYRIPMNEGRLSFGLKGGLRFFTNRLDSKVVTVDGDDPAFQSDIVSQPLPNLGVGVHYALNDFYVGFSIPKLLENELNNYATNVLSSEERHYFLAAGGAFGLNRDESVKLKPSVLLKMTESTLFQADLTFLFYFNNKIWVGPMYRTTNDMGILAGLNVSDKLKFGYAMDWSFGNQTGTYNNGTHELMLRYDFIFDKKEGIVSPRHF